MGMQTLNLNSRDATKGSKICYIWMSLPFRARLYFWQLEVDYSPIQDYSVVKRIDSKIKQAKSRV